MTKSKEKKELLNKKERAYLAIFLFIFIVSILGIYFILFTPKFLIKKVETKIEIIKQEEREDEIETLNYQSRFLDGVLVPNEQAKLYPIAAVIDNQPNSNIAIGLSKAALVYEVPTEGGSSRFLAIYNSNQDIEKIGPIRSARPYFIDLALDSSALLIHCGGSMNEFYFGQYFWRDNKKPAPHNIMIKSESWQNFLDNYGLREVKMASWLFANKKKEEIENKEIKKNQEILVYYSKNYQSFWQYNNEESYYYRQASPENETIKVNNLIFHYTSSRVLDEKLRLKIDLIGQGEAIICQLGICQEGTWKKNSSLERLRYYNKDGEEVVFQIGPTWVSIFLFLYSF